MNDGTVKYKGYKEGYRLKGMKNKRTKKVEAMRRREREKKREEKKRKQKKAYSVPSEYGNTYSDW